MAAPPWGPASASRCAREGLRVWAKISPLAVQPLCPNSCSLLCSRMAVWGLTHEAHGPLAYRAS